MYHTQYHYCLSTITNKINIITARKMKLTNKCFTERLIRGLLCLCRYRDAWSQFKLHTLLFDVCSVLYYYVITNQY